MTNTLADNPNYRTPASVIWGIIAVSAVASLFLAWLVYYHPPVDVAGTHLCAPGQQWSAVQLSANTYQ